MHYEQKKLVTQLNLLVSQGTYNLSYARAQLHNTILSPAESIYLTAVHMVYFATKVSHTVP